MRGGLIQCRNGHIEELEIAASGAIGEGHGGRQVLAGGGRHEGKTEHRLNGQSREFFHHRVGFVWGVSFALGG